MAGHTVTGFSLQELYSEVQALYLPQVLGCMLQPLAEEVETLSLPELTHALKTCFKVLSKVQMPPSYMDMEPTSGSSVCAPGPRRPGCPREWGVLGVQSSVDGKVCEHGVQDSGSLISAAPKPP